MSGPWGMDFRATTGSIMGWAHSNTMLLRAHVTHETESPRPLHFSTLIGGQGGARPRSLLHTTLEGPTDGVCECKMDVKSTWIPIHMVSNGSCFHGHLDYFQKPPLGGRSNTKPLGDHGTLNAHHRRFILFYHV